ncbi:hypothetical protein KGF56_002894 [Candida oxycetoniae]|uniref:Uncharacterized protein n=1 Tax=Candida oxycetoniae TaxID=497107 RepID=A0AAI9SWX6_9ASCO|nr:uncharacterized protein KGF56_002894 [Candida oxycetoniae]KAI3404255.2 hypothetical protein KGF56_002894 [Candida oxycetoniae]
MADHYISPKLLRTSIIKWPKLILNKLLVFGFNTYNILKFKREISKPLQFNEWKDTSIECYVRTNKIFAQACNNLGLSPTKEVFNLINLKLNQSCGNHLIGALCTRVLNFQSQTDKKVAWDLISIDANPKVVTFNVIPDEDGVGMYVQYVMNLKTTQKLTIADRLNPNKIITETESKVDDYLVYTMNPWDGRILLVGKLFESDASRGMKSDLDVFNNSVMEKFLTESADIYREDPRKKQLNGEAT